MNNTEAMQYLKKIAAREIHQGKNPDYCRGHREGTVDGAVKAFEAVGLITQEQANQFIFRKGTKQ